MTPDWLSSTFAALPYIVWMIGGLGLPWSLVILPRKDWRDRPMVACLMFAFGPALMTVWLFVLGTVGMNSAPGGSGDLNPMQTSIPLLIGGQNTMTPANIMIGSAIIALVGVMLAWRKRKPLNTNQNTFTGYTIPLALDEVLLIVLILAATIFRGYTTAFVPFGSWDELWVYGYQGKIYTLLGFIPRDIGYYPQFLQLQYAYTQIMTGGVSDHAARAVVPFLQMGSILATYLLGSRLFNRRTGIFAAALWALYPDFGYWTRIGDLEVPLTFAFTGAAAFFLMAWTYRERSAVSDQQSDEKDQIPKRKEVEDAELRQEKGAKERFVILRVLRAFVSNAFTATHNRYALISGLFLGIALWTKPTAGAFIWGVLLLFIVELIRLIPANRRTLPPELKEGEKGNAFLSLINGWGGGLYAALPRFQIVFLTGLACIPLGAIWYVRNLLLGHDAIVFPPSIWLTRAMQSGVEFGWPLLALGVLIVGLILNHKGISQEKFRKNTWRSWRLGGSTIVFILVGLILTTAALAPSILHPRQMQALEYGLLVLGAILLTVGLWRYARPRLTETGKRDLAILGWAQLLALPYFLTWFYSYSYHYRLSFPIVPLLLLPTAVILARWLTAERLGSWRMPKRVVYGAVVMLIGLPGLTIYAYDHALGWGWLDKTHEAPWSALTGSAFTLQRWSIGHGDYPPTVVAPGDQRLPFVFPTWDIRITDMPRSFADLEGATHFIDSSEAREVYGASGEGAPFQNQLWGGLRRENVATLVTHYYDSAFVYDTYELHLDQRFIEPPIAVRPEGDVRAGDFARYVGHSVSGNELSVDGDITLTLIWQGLANAPEDYGIYVHLIDAQTGDFTNVGWDGPVAAWEIGYYSTLFWEKDEYIIDHRTLRLPSEANLSSGDYRIEVGFYSLISGARVPITRDGAPDGDGIALETIFHIR